MAGTDGRTHRTRSMTVEAQRERSGGGDPDDADDHRLVVVRGLIAVVAEDGGAMSPLAATRRCHRLVIRGSVTDRPWRLVVKPRPITNIRSSIPTVPR